MRVLTILFIFIISAWTNAVGQDVTYSDYEEFDFRVGDFSVIGKISNNIFTYRGDRESKYLDIYNASLDKQATVILDFLPSKSFGIEFITYANQIVVFYQMNEGPNLVLYATVLSTEGRIVIKPSRLDVTKLGMFKGKNAYQYAVSKDKNTIVPYLVGTKGEKISFKALWLDNNLKRTASSITTFEADNRCAYGDLVVSNIGKLLLPVYTPIGSKQYADRLWLLALEKGAKEFEVAELDMENKYLAGTYMELDKAGNTLYAAGFYSSQKNGHYEGVLYASVDVNRLSFDLVKHLQFSDKIRAATASVGKKRAFNDFRAKELIVKNDGGFVLVAEEYYATIRSSFSPGFGYYSWYYPAMSTQIREYNYNDIITMSYSADGNLDWVRFIRKAQYSQQDGGLFSSFALLNAGGALGFLYNDFDASRSRIQLGSVDIDGNLNINTIGTLRSAEPDWIPRTGKQISSNEFLVPCLKRNKLCYAKIVF